MRPNSTWSVTSCHDMHDVSRGSCVSWRACRAVSVQHRTTRHVTIFFCAKMRGLDSVSCRDVTRQVDLEVPPVRFFTVGKRAFPVSYATCHNLERAPSPRRICAVTRGFQTTPSRPFCFPVPAKTLSYDSCVTITIHHYSVWTPVVLNII